jgi:hypothetical protein
VYAEGETLGWNRPQPSSRALLQSRVVFLRELIGRAAPVFAGDRLKVVDAYNCGYTRADRADKKTADLGAAFGNRAKTSHDLRS